MVLGESVGLFSLSLHLASDYPHPDALAGGEMKKKKEAIKKLYEASNSLMGIGAAIEEGVDRGDEEVLQGLAEVNDFIIGALNLLEK